MLVFVISEEDSKDVRPETCKRVLVNKEVLHFIDILFARRLLRLTPTVYILSSSLFIIN